MPQREEPRPFWQDFSGFSDPQLPFLKSQNRSCSFQRRSGRIMPEKVPVLKVSKRRVSQVRKPRVQASVLGFLLMYLGRKSQRRAVPSFLSSDLTSSSRFAENCLHYAWPRSQASFQILQALAALRHKSLCAAASFWCNWTHAADHGLPWHHL